MMIGAIITARSTSKRFPRKHLAELGGQPMIIQIINKLKKLKHLDIIVLSTTDNSTDDDLCDVCTQAGIEVYRGSEFNLLDRRLKTMKEFKITHALSVSGDCPFLLNEANQLVINAMQAYSDYDRYILPEFYCPMPGLLTNGYSIGTLFVYEDLMGTYPHTNSYEQYWLIGNDYPDKFHDYMIDSSSLIQREATPMKLSIDWNFERLIFNKIISWLGYYPETIEDFNKAYGGIEKLC